MSVAETAFTRRYAEAYGGEIWWALLVLSCAYRSWFWWLAHPGMRRGWDGSNRTILAIWAWSGLFCSL